MTAYKCFCIIATAPTLISKALSTPSNGALSLTLTRLDGGIAHSTTERGNQSRLGFAIRILSHSLALTPNFKVMGLEVLK
jgi:hypothetical protein